MIVNWNGKQCRVWWRYELVRTPDRVGNVIDAIVYCMIQVGEDGFSHAQWDAAPVFTGKAVLGEHDHYDKDTGRRYSLGIVPDDSQLHGRAIGQLASSFNAPLFPLRRLFSMAYHSQIGPVARQLRNRIVPPTLLTDLRWSPEDALLNWTFRYTGPTGRKHEQTSARFVDASTSR